MAFSIPGWRRWSGLQFQGIPLPVDAEGVITVGGEQRQLGAGRWLHPPDDEPHRQGIGLTGEGNAAGLDHVGGTIHPAEDGRPLRFGYGLDDVPHALVLANGDGEADLHLPADGDNGVGVEVAGGPHRGLAFGYGVAHSADDFTQEVSSPRVVLTRPSRRRAISTSPVPAATASSG